MTLRFRNVLPRRAVLALRWALLLSMGACLRATTTVPQSSAAGFARPRVEMVSAARQARKEIARAALAVEIDDLPRTRARSYTRRLDGEAEAILVTPPGEAQAAETLQALNQRFFGPEGFVATDDLSAPESVSLAAVLENRRGTCVGLAIVYLALADRLGLNAHAVATPVHLFVRVGLRDRFRNVELLEGGREIDDDTYRRRYKVDETSLAAGVFMRDLSNSEVIAHLLSNQGVALGKQGKLDDALARYDAALQVAPQLVAAWYNRGLDLMKAGRFEEALDSFDRAIELYPSDAQAHNNRGLTKLKLGDREGARVDFRRALELEPALTEAEENLKRLNAGDGFVR